MLSFTPEQDASHPPMSPYLAPGTQVPIPSPIYPRSQVSKLWLQQSCRHTSLVTSPLAVPHSNR